MAEIKVNVGDPKTRRTYTFTISEDDRSSVHGKKIGDTIRGELISKSGYELEITGGSDRAGFPMRADVDGTGRRKIFVTHSIGNRRTKGGDRVRRTVAGNTVSAETSQINVKVVKHGKAGLAEEASEEATEAPEEKKEEPEEKAEEEEKESGKDVTEEAPEKEPEEDKPEAEEDDSEEAEEEEKETPKEETEEPAETDEGDDEEADKEEESADDEESAESGEDEDAESDEEETKDEEEKTPDEPEAEEETGDKPDPDEYEVEFVQEDAKKE